MNLLRNGTDLKYESTDFRNGDDMYLHFLSPVSGHLLVYLVDHTAQQAYCLLPYSQQADAAQPIEQGRDYLFFSAQSVPADQRAVVDEYTLTTDKTMEQNEVVVVFSTDELVKANTSASIGQLPRAMEVDHFNKWLSALRTTNQKTQIIYKPITLKSNTIMKKLLLFFSFVCLCAAFAQAKTKTSYRNALIFAYSQANSVFEDDNIKLEIYNEQLWAVNKPRRRSLLISRSALWCITVLRSPCLIRNRTKIMPQRKVPPHRLTSLSPSPPQQVVSRTIPLYVI